MRYLVIGRTWSAGRSEAGESRDIRAWAVSHIEHQEIPKQIYRLQNSAARMSWEESDLSKALGYLLDFICSALLNLNSRGVE